MRRALLVASVAALILSAIAAVGTAITESLYAARVQRVAPYPEPLRALTGELGTMEGEPVDALVFASTPVLERKDGLVYIDRTAVYPLQVRSLRLAGHGAAGALAALALAGFLARAFVPSRTLPAPQDAASLRSAASPETRP